ncbi:Hsp20/alpha crystallin family protein [Patescibacteria group bacterium]|nr:Hsp20/alpha crystallin family protein [Patescibacteria group bacterium]
MPIIPWRPFWDMERWFEEEWPDIRKWPRFRFPMVRTPRMDIYETDKDVVAEVELPGVDPKNINVEVKKNTLKVEAKGEEKKLEKGEGYYRKELGRRYYKRIVPLLAEVVGEKANASYAEGLLKVVIPKVTPKKVKEKKPIKIKVKGTKTA